MPQTTNLILHGTTVGGNRAARFELRRSRRREKPWLGLAGACLAYGWAAEVSQEFGDGPRPQPNSLCARILCRDLPESGGCLTVGICVRGEFDRAWLALCTKCRRSCRDRVSNQRRQRHRFEKANLCCFVNQGSAAPDDWGGFHSRTQAINNVGPPLVLIDEVLRSTRPVSFTTISAPLTKLEPELASSTM